MSVVYFDTSALIKRYITEDGSSNICSLWDNATLSVSCWLLYPEMIATFARKRREKAIPTAHLDTAEGNFKRDWLSLVRVACDDDLIHRIDALHMKYALRGADSTHLAAAIKFREFGNEPVNFACADQRLSAAALTEGFEFAP